jgi:hypothetical protein
MREIGELLKEKNLQLDTLDPVLQGGFTQVPNFILKNSEISVGAKVTYAMFLSYAWHNDSCFPGQDRLRHLARAPEILRLSRTVQGIEKTHEWERRHKHGRWEKLLVLVTYYEFMAVIEDRRFKVIVKQLPGGERIFWSLIPFWRQDEQGRRVLYDGDPAQD